MALKTAKKNIIKDTIKELADEKAGLKIDEDEEFDPAFVGPRKISPFTGFRKDQDEIAVDELLAGLSNKAGWYLKLSKEIAANEYQFKIKITDFETWTDLELQIVNIVRVNTKRDPRRWGSGRYMIVAWNENGLRDKKPPRYIEVDAEEPVDVNSAPAVTGTATSPSEQLGAVADLLKTMNLLSPPTSPQDHLKLLTESYVAGQSAAGTKEASGNQSSMMMMVMMMGMMKEMVTSMRPGNIPTQPSSTDTMKDMLTMMTQLGVIGSPKDDVIATIGKFREAGLITQPAVVQDPMEQLTKLKQIASLFSELTPGGEPPSLINKLIDILAPAIPGMIANISNTVDKVAMLKKQALEAGGNGTRPQPARVFQVPPTAEQPQSQPEAAEPPPTTFEVKENPVQETEMINISRFTHELFNIVMTDDRTKYGYISDVLKSFFGDVVETGLRTRVMTADTLIGYIKSFDTKRYNTPEANDKLQTYVKAYVDSIQGNVTTYSVKCSKCGAICEFDSKEEWDTLPDSEKICGFELNPGNLCDGPLVEIIAA